MPPSQPLRDGHGERTEAGSNVLKNAVDLASAVFDAWGPRNSVSANAGRLGAEVAIQALAPGHDAHPQTGAITAARHVGADQSHAKQKAGSSDGHTPEGKLGHAGATEAQVGHTGGTKAQVGHASKLMDANHGRTASVLPHLEIVHH